MLIQIQAVTAQKLGVYVTPSESLSKSIDFSSIGFDAILVKADTLISLSESNRGLKKFAYPWLPTLKNLTDNEIEKSFINQASTVFSQFEFISYHPANLINAHKPLNYSFDKYYIERAFSYLKVAETIPDNKKAWLIMSFLDYPYAAEQMRKNTNLDIEAIIFKAYRSEDYQTRKLQRLVDLAKELNIKWIFLDQNHLQTALNQNPSLAIYLRSFQNDQQLDVQRLEYSRIVYYDQFGSILIIIFVSLFVLHFSISFRYQRSIQRYFTNVRFFLQDIKSWRNAITLPAWLILLKFVGLHALVQTALLSIIISPDGFALINSQLGVFSFNQLSPFMNTFLNVLTLNVIIHLFLLVWAKTINNGLRYFGQVASVYTYGLHLLFLLLIPTYLLIENLPQAFWFVSLAALAIMLLIPINHLRAQISLASIDSNGVLWSIGLGFIVFWMLFVGLLFFAELQFNWLNTFNLAIAIP